jgi:hypothetical protein
MRVIDGADSLLDEGSSFVTPRKRANAAIKGCKEPLGRSFLLAILMAAFDPFLPLA